ncbi:hypothetical protein PSTT_09469 [Puccinia striiformis]|uniref:Uncharacterized protein n=1 Tax=Puccinia striiformis TaxID=27350 RepID=A0A2S4V836_9BASI|nr:hypothetical protein PSTT_09469 [Puccinia striiformis]
MTLHSRSNRCTVGSSKTVAVDLFDSIDYCQDELGIMTLVQRSYLHKHPTLWLEKKVNEGDHLDDDPTGSPSIEQFQNNSVPHTLLTIPPIRMGWFPQLFLPMTMRGSAISLSSFASGTPLSSAPRTMRLI